MSRHSHRDGPSTLHDEAVQKQRNVVWPDPLINSRAVDWLLWHGSPNATTVQRIAAAVFGLAYLSGSALSFFWSIRKDTSLPFFVSLAFLFVGWKVLVNALPYRWTDLAVPMGMVLLGFGWIIAYLTRTVWYH